MANNLMTTKTPSILPFQYGAAQVRAIRDAHGEPWFVAKDVCNALGIKNSRDAVDRLDDDEKGVVQTDTLGGPQKVTIVNESGLYSLILRSDKPEAKAFKRWITHEVLPAIRKTGGYVIGESELDEAELTLRVMQMLQNKVALLKSETEAQKLAIAEQKPKAEAFDDFMSIDGSVSYRDAARVLGVPLQKLMRHLRDNGFITKEVTWSGEGFSSRRIPKNMPYAKWTNKGLFVVKAYVNKKNSHSGVRALVTNAGIEFFRKHLKSA